LEQKQQTGRHGVNFFTTLANKETIKSIW